MLISMERNAIIIRILVKRILGLLLHQCNAPPHTIIEFMSLQAFYVICV